MVGSWEEFGGPREPAIEAERAVLGALLIDGSRFDEAAEILSSDDWFRQAHRLIWRAVGKVASSGAVIDLLTVKAALTPEELDEVGGPVYLAGLTDGVPRSSHLAHYAQLVRDYAVRRQIEQIGRSLIAAAANGEETGAELLARGETALLALRTTQPGTQVAAPSDRATAVLSTVEAASEGRRRGTHTGLRELDEMTQGFRPGQLVVLGARPSQGKTALALTMAVGAGDVGPVLFCSLEMSAEQINVREAALRSGIGHAVLDSGHIPAARYASFSSALQSISEGQIYVLDRPGATLSQIRGAARRLKATTRGPLSLVVVDYLQLMRPERGSRPENRTLEVAQFSGGLKLLARELEVPVIALSQLSRQSELRSDKSPLLADLRESGALEQDADVVLLLHRPGVYDPTVPSTRADLVVAKQRNGPTGKVNLDFDGDTMRFTDAAGIRI